MPEPEIDVFGSLYIFSNLRVEHFDRSKKLPLRGKYWPALLDVAKCTAAIVLVQCDKSILRGAPVFAETTATRQYQSSNKSARPLRCTEYGYTRRRFNRRVRRRRLSPQHCHCAGGGPSVGALSFFLRN